MGRLSNALRAGVDHGVTHHNTPALGRFELYDLGRDPAERENRYGTAPEGDSMRQVLQRWRETVPAPPQPSGYDPRFGDRLRALGYVQ